MIHSPFPMNLLVILQMNKIVFILGLLFFPSLVFAQQEEKWINSLEDAKKVSPDSVFYLRLRDKNLKTIPNQVYRFKNIRKLDLSVNNIHRIPRRINLLVNLEELNLAYNPIKYFPIELCDLNNLVSVNLLFSKVEFLPECIYKLTNLKYLNLSGSRIKILPNSIFELQDLRELYIGWQKDNHSPFSKKQQAEIKIRLPNCEVFFD